MSIIQRLMKQPSELRKENLKMKQEIMLPQLYAESALNYFPMLRLI
jgi:hypothetical protein